jgi:hypothetical protein
MPTLKHLQGQGFGCLSAQTQETSMTRPITQSQSGFAFEEDSMDFDFELDLLSAASIEEPLETDQLPAWQSRQHINMISSILI